MSAREVAEGSLLSSRRDSLRLSQLKYAVALGSRNINSNMTLAEPILNTSRILGVNNMETVNVETVVKYGSVAVNGVGIM
jgi:hypothetical protein